MTTLYLGMSSIDDEGTKAIAGALSSGTVVLTKLDLEC